MLLLLQLPGDVKAPGTWFRMSGKKKKWVGLVFVIPEHISLDLTQQVQSILLDGSLVDVVDHRLAVRYVNAE